MNYPEDTGAAFVNTLTEGEEVTIAADFDVDPIAMTERCWRAYQLGQGSADHTARDVFLEVVGQLALEIFQLRERASDTAERISAMNTQIAGLLHILRQAD